METAFAECMDKGLLDAPNVDEYKINIPENVSAKEISKKYITQGIGIQLAKDIRGGQYRYIPTNAPIIFTTWLDKNIASRDLLTIQNAWYIQKETTMLDYGVSINKEALCHNIDTVIQDILRR
jgi:hypothetical protein